MKPSVLFIFSPFAGHLNKTTLLARFYYEKGYYINYLIFGSAAWLDSVVPFANIIRTTHHPVGISNTDSKERQDPMTCYENRRKVLREVVSSVNPSLIFFDQFCTTDFIVQYELFKHCRCIFRGGRLPNLPGNHIPPLHSLNYPGYLADIHWIGLRMYHWIRQYYLLYSNPAAGLLWYIKQLKKDGFEIPKFTFFGDQYPYFPGLEWWYKAPVELDFIPRKLPENSRYVGPMIDLTRSQQTLPRVSMFLKMIESQSIQTLIYCTFGTVLSSLVSTDDQMEFYQKMNSIARKRPEWAFLVSAKGKVYEQLRPSGLNILFATDVPQLEVLQRSSLCINHGGGGTVNECLYFGVPMLCITYGSTNDLNGNASRVAYHKLGLTCSLICKEIDLERLLESLIESSTIKDNVLKMSQRMQTNYGTDYLSGLGLPEA